MKQVIIEETDFDKNGKEIVIDKQILNVCKKCISEFIGNEFREMKIRNTSYDADCDECGEFE